MECQWIPYSLSLSLFFALTELLIALYLYRKYQLAIFNALFYYILFMNLFSFYGYWQTDIAVLFMQGKLVAFGDRDVLHFVITYLAIPFLVFGEYFFFKFFRLLSGNGVTRLFKLYFFSIQLFVYMTSGMIVYAYAGMSRMPLASGQAYFEALYLFIDFIVVVLALSQPFLQSTPHRRKPAVTLSVIYLVVLLPNYVLYIIYGNTGLTYSILLVLVHLIDLPPLLYLLFYLKKRGGAWLQHSTQSRLKRYGITKREEEILYLICEGKSNREISELLFISLQTVKDHIHSVFRKTAVKNRVQLVNRFQNTVLPDRTDNTESKFWL